ncbi:5-formyltetrahydrofolate cyclo-ligase [Mumia sp. zg.B17]|uniref:5-formyltetrahydrofolate cyclo-ligase n=1 Tax=unclassified Mumia TaxID=2621872 RepID=UPI001C6DFCC3|nr:MULTISPECIES: 5-formyltetrahydrofolate cyclo-ligase [unclassified Mumia]MBW9206955.1 5-formyltetrahydrofolate cyclo-ligase [Mumia sp. zg.B17]MDD9349977.1 5-formyltetrahydrofolate cyclo-ligase [Mumia sp.]
MTDKRLLREQLLEARADLDEAAVAAAGTALGRRAHALVREHAGRSVAAYLSVGREPPTWPLLDALLAEDVEVVVPRALPRRQLSWVRYAGRDALVIGRFGIPEPRGEAVPDALAGTDVAIVPALAVDAAGFRLGRGGGYYDEALASCERPLRVALVYDHELVDDVHPEAHDQRVDVALSPARTVELPPR